MLNLFLSETADKSASAGNSWWIYVVLIVMVLHGKANDLVLPFSLITAAICAGVGIIFAFTLT